MCSSPREAARCHLGSLAKCHSQQAMLRAVQPGRALAGAELNLRSSRQGSSNGPWRCMLLQPVMLPCKAAYSSVSVRCCTKPSSRAFMWPSTESASGKLQHLVQSIEPDAAADRGFLKPLAEALLSSQLHKLCYNFIKTSKSYGRVRPGKACLLPTVQINFSICAVVWITCLFLASWGQAYIHDT